ncbi:MAG: hypothetical protein H6811_09505 [Phycisphaeraceae bacterium]|nr:hypothetical protein [Phycisphaeraceae bacterium]
MVAPCDTRPQVYYGTPRRETVVIRETPRVVYQSPVMCEPAPVVCAVTIEQGWSELSRGDYRAALRTFSTVAEAQPHRSLAKVGFALASAAQNDDRSAIRAMRAAFKADADSLRFLPKDENISGLILALKDKYYQHTQQYYSSPDPHFMLSSLCFMIGDVEGALGEVARAEDQGDRDLSVRELRRVIQQEHPDYASPYGR